MRCCTCEKNESKIWSNYTNQLHKVGHKSITEM